jgi:hypothetical protein
MTTENTKVSSIEGKFFPVFDFMRYINIVTGLMFHELITRPDESYGARARVYLILCDLETSTT